MTQIQLRIHTQPTEVIVFCAIERIDRSLERLAAVIDTGAEVSLLPDDLLDKVVHRRTGCGAFIVEQAGIAGQEFEAIEAYITMFFEDPIGNQTKSLEVRVWFANTDKALIGFADVLDRGVLHIDMLNRAGWLEIDV